MSVSAIEEFKNLNEDVDALAKDVIANKADNDEEEEFIKNDMPLILSNEVIQTPNGESGISKGLAMEEKGDELSSLEREIAKLHNVEPTVSIAQDHANVIDDNVKSNDNGKQEKMTVEMQNAKADDNGITPNVNELDLATINNGTPINNTPNENELEHDDLIAVLKGIDHASSESLNVQAELEKDLPANRTELVSHSHSISDNEMVDGVTIEGEGQFQIMEVIDDEVDELLSIKAEMSLEANSAPQQSHPVAKQYGNNVPNLTQEEVRALAMEQIAGLNAGVNRQRRRKQDMKPLQVESTDLLSSLGADWSDDEANNIEQADAVPTTISTEAANSSTAKKGKTSPVEKVDSAKLPTSSNVDQPKRRSSPPKVTSVVVLQGGSEPVAIIKSKLENKKQSSSNKMDESNKAAAAAVATNELDAAVSAPKVTGFKRTRIIKRKIIWDPDDPETQFAYAQLVRNTSTTSKSTTNIGNSSVSPTAVPAAVAVPKKETAHSVKKPRPLTPKERKLTAPVVATEIVEKKNARSATPAKLKATSAAVSNVAISQSTKSPGDDEEAVKSIPSPVKRRSQTPVSNGAGKKKKIKNEIDRLMGDEGAVNMLNSLEYERHKMDDEEQTSDKPHKPLMRSRATTISERIVKRETTPTLLKKEVSTASKAKRITKQKPSSTWDYVYKQQASEDSMIIRRRSNSSYSSTASLHRLSLDTPPATSKTSTKSTSSAGKAHVADKSAGKTTKSTPKTPLTNRDDDDDDDDDESLADILQQSSSNAKQSTPTTSGKNFEFAKPESKSNQKVNRRIKSPSQSTNPLTSDMKKATTPTAGKRPASKPATTDNETKENKHSKLSTTGSSSNKDLKEEGTSGTHVASTTSDVIVKKSSKVAQIIFNTHKAKIDYTFTAQMMNKLVDILDKLSNDIDCHVVVITTSAPHFCHGIDFTDLTNGSAEKRKNAAIHLATAVKNYLKTLATFPKPLIAGVNGNNIGLGVTQLPLFDIVVASDKGSYETPYAKIGQVPEGYCIWNNITKIRGTFKTKLFWLCEKLHSTESALSGLVNKLTAPSKVNEDALATARKIAAMSAESYRVMKKTTIHNHLDAIISALDEEFDTIIGQWTSTECYEHFKKYLESRNA